MGLEEDFQVAADLMSTGVKKSKDDASNEEKLKLYGLFKQCKNGDCTESAPWMPGEGKYKHEAWSSNKGKSKDQAMTEYIAEANNQKAKYDISMPS